GRVHHERHGDVGLDAAYPTDGRFAARSRGISGLLGHVVAKLFAFQERGEERRYVCGRQPDARDLVLRGDRAGFAGTRKRLFERSGESRAVSEHPMDGGEEVGDAGLEPATSPVLAERSPAELTAPIRTRTSVDG